MHIHPFHSYFFPYPSISGSDHSSLFSASHFISSLFQLGIPLCAFNILFFSSTNGQMKSGNKEHAMDMSTFSFTFLFPILFPFDNVPPYV